MNINELTKDLPTTQTEEIVWHKYRDELPSAEEFNIYLISINGVGDHNIIRIAAYVKIINLGMVFWIDDRLVDNAVVAWAELPEGWK